MVAVRIPKIQQHDVSDPKPIHYMERILELIEKRCFAQAKALFSKYDSQIEILLSPEYFIQLRQRVELDDDWNQEKSKLFHNYTEQVIQAQQYVDVHDYAHEILLHIKEPSADSPSQEKYDRLNTILAKNNAHFVDPDEVAINTFIDAPVEFIVEKRRGNQEDQRVLKGNPGFYLKDSIGCSYRCFIKQVSNVEVGDILKLKITNIPGMEIDAKLSKEKIVYVEPRTVPGETIEIEVMNLSHTGNSFTFRHHSYDGFLWFKRRGVNKELFNINTIKSKDKILAKVLYTSEEVKQSHKGQITRLGIIKAIPLKRILSE